MGSLENLRHNAKRLRIAQGLSQEALAEKAGLEYKHYQKIETGLLKGVQLRTIDSVAGALRVTASVLLCDPAELPAKALPNLPSGRPHKKRKKRNGQTVA